MSSEDSEPEPPAVDVASLHQLVLDLASQLAECRQETADLRKELTQLRAEERLNDLEDNLEELGLEVRLQAHRSANASAMQLSMCPNGTAMPRVSSTSNDGISPRNGQQGPSPRYSRPGVATSGLAPQTSVRPRSAVVVPHLPLHQAQHATIVLSPRMGATSCAGAGTAHHQQGYAGARASMAGTGSNHGSNHGSPRNWPAGPAAEASAADPAGQHPAPSAAPYSPRSSTLAGASSTRTGSTDGCAGTTPLPAQPPPQQQQEQGAATAGGALGAFGNWGAAQLDGTAEAKAAMAMAEQALAKMQDLASSTELAVQNMHQLRDRWAHMEQRVEDMWQVQETDLQLQAGIGRLHRDFLSLKEQLQQVQVVAEEARDAGQEQQIEGEASSQEARQLQEHVRRLEMGMAELRQERQTLLQQGMATEQLQATVSALSSEAQASVIDLQAQLEQQRSLIDAASATGAAALERCEELRRQSTLHNQRLDSFTGYVKDVVKPVSARCDDLQAALAAINKGLPANTSMLVQRDELQRSLAAATDSLGRQQASCMKVLAGLEGRMEALAESAARGDDVMSKAESRAQLARAMSDLEVVILQSRSELADSLKLKADAKKLKEVDEQLTGRLATLEAGWLQGLRAVSEKVAAALGLKADLGSLEELRKHMLAAVAEIEHKVDGGLAHEGPLALDRVFGSAGGAGEHLGQQQAGGSSSKPHPRTPVAPSRVAVIRQLRAPSTPGDDRLLPSISPWTNAGDHHSTATAERPAWEKAHTTKDLRPKPAQRPYHTLPAAAPLQAQDLLAAGSRMTGTGYNASDGGAWAAPAVSGACAGATFSARSSAGGAAADDAAFAHDAAAEPEEHQKQLAPLAEEGSTNLLQAEGTSAALPALTLGNAGRLSTPGAAAETGPSRTISAPQSLQAAVAEQQLRTQSAKTASEGNNAADAAGIRRTLSSLGAADVPSGAAGMLLPNGGLGLGARISGSRGATPLGSLVAAGGSRAASGTFRTASIQDKAGTPPLHSMRSSGGASPVKPPSQ